MESVRVVIASRCRDFANTTVIRVFLFIKNAENTVERGFWALIFFAFLAATVYEVRLTVEKFSQEPTVTTVLYTNNINATFSNPQIALTFSKVPEQSFCEGHKNATFLDGSYVETLLDNIRTVQLNTLLCKPDDIFETSVINKYDPTPSSFAALCKALHSRNENLTEGDIEAFLYLSAELLLKVGESEYLTIFRQTADSFTVDVPECLAKLFTFWKENSIRYG